MTLRRILALALTLVAIPAVAACATARPTVTHAELHADATRTYVDVEPADLVAVSSAALATLGYEVTFCDEARGLIKTAPKVVVVEGIGVHTGNVTSVTTAQNAIAWTLEVVPGERGTTVTAMPQGFSNGQPIPENTPWDADYMRGVLGTLFDEIDGMLGTSG